MQSLPEAFFGGRLAAMLRRHRSIIVAVAGIWLVGASPSKQIEVQPQAEKSALTVEQRLPIAVSAVANSVPLPADQGCRPGQDNRHSDLCAQWKAADAAFDSAHWSLWQLILGSGLGVATMAAAIAAAVYARRAAIATEETVKIARNAASEAKDNLAIANRSADAAVKLADQAEKNAQRQLRAYLTVKPITLEEHPDKEDFFVLDLVIVNNGQTPATMESLTIKVSWAYGDGSCDIIEHSGRVKVYLHKGLPSRIPIPFKVPFAGYDKDGHFIIYGRINYEDVFGCQHHTPFSFRTDPDDFGQFYDLDLPYTFSAFPLETMLEKIEAEAASSTSETTDNE